MTARALWRREFGDAYAVPRELDAFVDLSWHNDTCPSFTDPAFADADPIPVKLWVEHVDPYEREYPERPRFAVTVDDTVRLETDELARALDTFRACVEARARCPFCYGDHRLAECLNIDPEQGGDA
jgi:hypothetical protein